VVDVALAAAVVVTAVVTAAGTAADAALNRAGNKSIQLVEGSRGRSDSSPRPILFFATL
jgi:hypothetical protein